MRGLSATSKLGTERSNFGTTTQRNLKPSGRFITSSWPTSDLYQQIWQLVDTDASFSLVVPNSHCQQDIIHGNFCNGDSEMRTKILEKKESRFTQDTFLDFISKLLRKRPEEEK
jgi:hypothetical protein